ncbi:MAG: single-stranded DNA-binding protein [bacterium]
MPSLNRVFLAGNLTRDPVVRYTPAGSAVVDLSMAINRVYTVDGKQKEETCFVDLVAWGKTAENCGQYLTKGSPILIEGGLQLDQWTGKDGEKRSKLRVRADRVQFLGRPKKAEYGDAPEGAAPQGAVAAAPAHEDEPLQAADAAKDDDLPF